MERLKARVRYALLAALDLAEHYEAESRVKLQEIAARTGVPRQFLAHIMVDLKEGALVRSTRGSKGGYRLTRPPDRITAAQVVAAVEPEEEPDSGSGGYDAAVNRLWRQAQEARRARLARITMADLLEEVSE